MGLFGIWILFSSHYLQYIDLILFSDIASESESESESESQYDSDSQSNRSFISDSESNSDTGDFRFQIFTTRNYTQCEYGTRYKSCDCGCRYKP